MENSIWITGASSGIGKALALKFAKNNWKVAISARREELLKDIEKSIRNRDHIDSTRKVAPLKIPKNAVVIDTENKNVNKVSREILNLVK